MDHDSLPLAVAHQGRGGAGRAIGVTLALRSVGTILLYSEAKMRPRSVTTTIHYWGVQQGALPLNTTE